MVELNEPLELIFIKIIIINLCLKLWNDFVIYSLLANSYENHLYYSTNATTYEKSKMPDGLYLLIYI